MGQNQFPFQIILMKIKRMLPQISDGINLFLILDGQADITVNGEVFPMESEDMLLVNSSEQYEITSTRENITLYLNISKSKMENYFGEAWTKRFFCNTKKMEETEKGSYNSLREKVAHLMLAELRKGPDYPVEVNQHFYSLLACLLRDFQVENTVPGIFPATSDNRLLHITETIRNKYSQQLSLKELAEEEFMSYHHLSRIFKRELGMTFTEYVHRVRMAHATEELRQTDHSIIRIAQNNGFVNVKAFHQAFKEEFGSTPKEYRKKFLNNQSSLCAEGRSEYQVLERKRALQDIARYMVEKDIAHDGAVINEVLRLDVPDVPRSRLSPLKKIINIGAGALAMDKVVQAELKALQQELNFQLVRFFCFQPEEEEGTEEPYSIRRSLIHQWFDSLERLRLLPMIRLQCPEAVSSLESGKRWCDLQLQLLRELLNRYGQKALETWYLEWQLQDQEAPPELEEALYRYFYRKVKFFLPGIKLGVFTLTGLNKKEESRIEHFLQLQYDKCCIPDFYSFSAVPDDMEPGAYDQDAVLRFYGENVHQALKVLLARLKSNCPQASQNSEAEVFLTEWNTLSGKNGVLSGSFFRAALIMENMIGLAQSGVSGVGYWLNMASKDRESKERREGILSVYYLYERIKRPLYYCLSFLENLGKEVLESGQGYLLTRAGEQLQLLIFNSNYFDPLYSVDEYWLKSQSREFTVILKGLENGTYKIRQYELSKDHGGIYNDMLRAGGDLEPDRETQEYLIKTIIPQLIVNKIQAEQNEIAVKTVLSLNACKLYIFQPLY